VAVITERANLHRLIGLALVTMATLLLQTSLMRVFSVLFANHYAFLIISTALLGFAAAGAVLPMLRWLGRWSLDQVLSWLTLLYSAAIAAALALVIIVPLRLLLIYDNWGQLANLALYYGFLSIPFFFGGLVVCFLVSSETYRVNILYFADLVGAGIGCLLVIPILPAFGGSGAVLSAALLVALGALAFSRGAGWPTRGVAVLAVALVATLVPLGTTKLEIPLKEEKRRFAHDAELGRIEYTKWSAISRIDVAPRWPDGKTIWIDSGSNESVMVSFDGRFEALPPDTTHRGLPYRLRPRGDALIIGPSGGRELLAALSYKMSHIDAVELDPTIVRIVTHEYRDYIGGIFNHPSVDVVVDEGRSFLRRSRRQYDVIQQINSFTPVSLASGALNLSETYLITVEAFLDYLEHLKPRGLLAISRWGELRLASVALEALERYGVREPQRHLAILDARGWAERLVLVGKASFSQAEVDSLRAFGDRYGYATLYLPDGTGSDSLLVSFVRSADRESFYRQAGFNLFPTTDNRPFFDHLEKFGHFKTTANLLPDDFRLLLTYYNIADITLLVLLGEACLLSLLFVILPNWFLNRVGVRVERSWSYLLYFFCLGLGFIMLEIAAVQRFTLFIGSPLYAVTTVLFALLASAGLGSYLARRRGSRPLSLLPKVLPLISLLIIVLGLGAGAVFGVSLALPLPARVSVAVLMIAPVGLLMGMPFPLGLRAAASAATPLVPWMWAVNGYASVIGSVLAVILALNVGFRAVLLIAAGLYVAALCCTTRFQK
jgi:hypothetical protein